MSKKHTHHHHLLLAFVALIFASALFMYFSDDKAESQAGGNIVPPDCYAWNDAIGWIDFCYYANISVDDAQLQGYASSSVEEIALDCATAPTGNICAISNFWVSNDTIGNLAGWAWNEAVGWISFCGNDTEGSVFSGGKWVCPTSPTYQVTIDDVAGDFLGWAWNDAIGWISFNCANEGTCGTSDYKVRTSWEPRPPVVASGTLTSAVFDAETPVTPNALLWRGTLGNESTVRFQLASSNCANGKTNPPDCDDAGTWEYKGPGGTENSYYEPSGPGVAVKFIYGHHFDARYFRYKMLLEIFEGGDTPVVEDVIINWSP